MASWCFVFGVFDKLAGFKFDLPAGIQFKDWDNVPIPARKRKR
jgi:hypothetical protein